MTNTRSEMDGLLLRLNVARIVLAEEEEEEEARIVVSLLDVTERKRAEQETRLLQTIALGIGETEDLNSALDVVLREVCETTGWVFGEAWVPRPDGTCLEAAPAWCSRVPGLERFRQASQEFTFAPGVGLPGRVWVTRKPLWIPDVTRDPDFPRAAHALEAGLKAAMAIPVLAGDQVVLAMDFFVFELRQEDAHLVELVSAVAAQLGTVIQRKQAEEALRQQEAKLKALINNTQDTVWSIDTQYRLTTTNTSFRKGLALLTGREINDGESVFSGVPPAIQDEWQPLYDRALAGEAFTYESVDYLGFRGSMHRENSLNPIRGQDGSVIGVACFSRDISERKRRGRELEVIAAMSATLRVAQTRAEMLPVILDQLLNLLDVQGAVFATRDPLTGETVLELGRGVWSGIAGTRLAPGQGMSGRVIASGQPYVSNDVAAEPHIAKLDLHGGLPTAACVPLVAQQQTIGALWVGSRTAIAADQVRLLTTIADIVANAIRRVTLYEQTEKRLGRIDALRMIDMAITGSLDPRVTLNVLLDQVTTRLGVHAASVLLLNPHLQTLEFAAGRGFRTTGIERSHLRLGEGHAGLAALERRVVHVSNLSESVPTYARAQLLASEGFITYCAAPLISKGRVTGVLEIFHREPFECNQEWLEFLQALAAQAAIAIDNAGLFDDLQRSNVELTLAYDTTIEGWSHALDLRDKETEGHTLRVTDMTLKLARVAGITDAEMVHVRRGALLHDIGKMGVPDGILLKPGKLTDEEWVQVRRHPQFAYDMLAPIAYLKPALDIPYCHHEKWDGTGYPRGLKGEEIPLVARIFAVVDVWDALRSDRPYRVAWDEEKVREHILAGSGTHFDPKVVEVFLKMRSVE